MPTRPTKGDHGTADAGSHGRGNQKATYGSAVDPDVAEGRNEVEREAAGGTEREGAGDVPPASETSAEAQRRGDADNAD